MTAVCLGALLVGEQAFGGQHGAAWLADERVHVAGIADEGSGGDFVRGAGLGAAGAGDGVVSRAPARVEGHAEAADGQTEQQRLEPQQARDGVDLVHGAQELDGVAVRLQRQGFGVVGEINKVAAVAGCGGGVALDHDLRAGVFGGGGVQHGAEAAGAGETVLDGGVAGGLVHHQHSRAALRARQQRGVERRGGVVFGQRVLVLERNKVTALAEQVVGQRAGRVQYCFQARRLGRVEIDAAVVGDQAQRRRAVGAQVSGAEEAVLQRPIGDAAFCGEVAGAGRGGAVAPAGDGLGRAGGHQAEANAACFGEEGCEVWHLADDAMGQHVDSPGGRQAEVAHDALLIPSP